MDKELAEKLDRIIELLEGFDNKLDDIYDTRTRVESVGLDVERIVDLLKNKKS